MRFGGVIAVIIYAVYPLVCLWVFSSNVEVSSSFIDAPPNCFASQLKPPVMVSDAVKFAHKLLLLLVRHSWDKLRVAVDNRFRYPRRWYSFWVIRGRYSIRLVLVKQGG